MPPKKETHPVQHGSLAVKPDRVVADKPTGFWESPSLEALAERQHIGPTTDASVLLGGWPGDVNDNFEDMVRKLRRESAKGIQA